MGSPYDSTTFGRSLSLRVDGGVGAVSISPTGRDVVLAGRRGLYVVDLDDPFSPPRWLRHLTSWEVADVQWSPHASIKPAWVISTSNQKATVWNLARTGENAIEHVLHGHTRAITDINFHPDHPEILATCSVDTQVLVWDTRLPKRPVYSVADWRAGAAQVKWNFQNEHLLASAHDNYFYVWDTRNSLVPVHKIKAHDRKINGVDFSRTKENEIISASSDGTVKFWDLAKSDKTPTSVITTEFPVWRARHLPFGHGCAIMPLRRGHNAIYIANHKDLTGESKLRPSYVFKGHTDRVTDFLWRQRHSGIGIDDREFQLVTWSKDCDLRLWNINDELYEKLDFERGVNAAPQLQPYEYVTYRKEPVSLDDHKQIALKKTEDTFVSSRGDQANDNTKEHLNWLAGVRMGRSAFAPPIDRNPNAALESPDNLGEEVSVVGHKFPKVRFEKISVSTGILVLSLNGPWGAESEDLVFLRVELKFPKQYPRAPVTFRLEENSDLLDEKRQEMLKSLNEISKKFAEVERFAMEACLRFLMGEKIDLDNLRRDSDDDDSLNIADMDEAIGSLPSTQPSTDNEDDDDDDDDDDDEELIPMIRKKTTLSSSGLNRSTQFDSTPIPKGCGATWTKTGQLVCFFIPKQQPKIPQKQSVITFEQQGFDLSDDSLADEWADVLERDAATSRKLPGVFRIQNLQSNTIGGTSTSKHTSESVTEKSVHSLTLDGTMNNVVAIFDFTHLIPSKLELASEYRVLGDTPRDLALHNAQVCEDHGYTDLRDAWNVLELVLRKDFYWGSHPFGRLWLVKEMMAYFERLGNVQMLATMSCILHVASTGPVEEQMDYLPVPQPTAASFRKHRLSSVSDHTGSNYSDSHYRLSSSRSSSVVASNMSMQLPEKNIDVKIEMMNETALGYGEESFSVALLDNEDERYNRYRSEYANILYAWGLVLRRAEVLKLNDTLTVSMMDSSRGKLAWMNGVKDCAYCGLKLSRRLFACSECNHALHADCANEWWTHSSDCATGCGCQCLQHRGV